MINAAITGASGYSGAELLRFLTKRHDVFLQAVTAGQSAGKRVDELYPVFSIENSIDAVSDRDVQIEFLFACAITMMHLSRFAEDLVLWCSEEWSFAEIGDEFTTGSSIMPQKKNPDMAELVRGKTGRVYGDLVALLTVMKGLPLAYNRDMQEDKEPLFDAADTVRNSLDIFSGMFSTVKFNEKRFEGESDFLLATELADYLARKGMPFRKAHAVVGKIVRECLSKNIMLKELPLASYQKHSKLFDRNLWKILHLRASLRLKRSAGSTSPAEVRKSLKFWAAKLRSKVYFLSRHIRDERNLRCRVRPACPAGRFAIGPTGP